MTARNNEVESPGAQTRKRRTLRRVLLWGGSIAGILLIALLITGDILLHHAGPLLKGKVIETLSTRFDSRVELDRFQVSVFKGFEVSGSGLKLYPNHLDMSEPLIAVDRFYFHALSWRQLFKTPMYINKVEVKGLFIHLPPKNQRANMPHLEQKQNPGVDESRSGIKIQVGEIVVDRADLVIENGKPGKVPLNFVIHKLQLHSVGAGRPMRFHATLVNPKPIGNIDSSGDFGPFNAESPAETPVSGRYTFRKADLSTIKGIGGILASNGSYQGQLNRIVVDGETTTPDFRLDIADSPMPLDTKFHAIVDGTNGDTYLQPVDAWLAKTHIVASGDVVRVPGVHGRDIRLNVTVDPGRIQDLLQLAVKTQPPLMNGQVQIHTSFNLPPGDAAVTDKLQLKGSFSILDTHFTNPTIQSKVDELSLRGQGKADQAKQEGEALKAGHLQAATAAEVASEMRGNFIFGGGKIQISALNYRVPGANVAVSGVYSLDGQTFNFTGTARLDAHVSQMVTGWKSWLLKPVDPFFAKNGAGTQVPIKITGTRSAPQIGLNF
jgi:hypothetical protein